MKDITIKKAIETMWDDIPSGVRKDGGVAEDTTKEKKEMEAKKEDRILVVSPTAFKILLDTKEIKKKNITKDSCMALIYTPTDAQLDTYRATGEMLKDIPKGQPKGWVKIYKQKMMKSASIT